MNSEPSRAGLERLRAIDWSDDSAAYEHAQSRRLLMHEHLRRSALWAQAYGAEGDWPFFDVTRYIDKEFRLPPALATELDECLKKVAYSARKTCGAAVRLAELRARGDIAMPDLPDLYEPLILFYERGGEYLQDGAGFLDLTGVSIKPRGLRHHLVDLPFLTLDTRTLDALDAKGRISYHAPADRSGLVVRRRLLKAGEQRDEVFTQDLRWEPTDLLRLSGEKKTDAVYTQIGDIDAAQLIQSAVLGVSRPDASRPDMTRIDIDDPEFEMAEDEVALYRGGRFTGEVVEYQRGALVSLVTYKEGVEDGPSKEWYVDGTLRSDGVLRGGLPVGESTDWHRNGRPAARVLMSANGLRQLEITEWDDEGNLTKEWRAERG